MTAAQKILIDYNKKPSEYNSTDLENINQIICGYTAQDISSFKAEAVQ